MKNESITARMNELPEPDADLYRRKWKLCPEDLAKLHNNLVLGLADT